MEKKLGRWYLLELVEKNNELKIELYKKLLEGEQYQCIDIYYNFHAKEYEKALDIYNSMNLKNVFDKFKELKMAETLKRDINHYLERANLRKTDLEFYVKSLEEFVAQCKEGDEDYLEELRKEIKSCKNAIEEENEIISKMEDQLEKIK